MVSNSVTTIPASNQDTDLVNPWGIILVGNQIWVANNASQTITTYNLSGVKIPPSINVLGVDDAPENPTGIANNTTAGYVITNPTGPASAPATILVATEQGTVNGYTASLSTTRTFNAFQATDSAVYTGMALTASNIYLADFFNRKIDVLNNSFVLQPPASFPFIDQGNPSIPADFAPYNVAIIGGLVYVLYARQTVPPTTEDIPGLGNGYISIFTLNGIFIKRFVSNGFLNSPWGIIQAPSSCGLPSGAFFVGNNGDGVINIYNSVGTHIGKLKDCAGVDIFIDGLWGLVNVPTVPKSIFFSSGPLAEEFGLVGKLTKC